MDISGWIRRDNKDGAGDAFIEFVPGTIIQPGAFESFEPEPAMAGSLFGAIVMPCLWLLLRGWLL
ncbi:hypothetical protein [Arthrobacter sp. UYCo732]|uniref:hypothetical protein n=1 Tax=Arthrobacter sp. UYCo732 TaxID=3156336 RepID=UPI0033951F77